MNGIGFKNMKVFKENQWFDFKNITLLTGTNNSGKSSIINAMQMLQENINGRNIDDLLKTEFKLRTNQNKYGSIETFVNNESKGKDEYFVFSRQSGNIEYEIKVQVNKGLESYGSVKTIQAIDLKTNGVIFVLNVKTPYPDYQCDFAINYKYFVDRFYEKCRNTETLRQRKAELDEMVKMVNIGEKTLNDLEYVAARIKNEFSIDVETYPVNDANHELLYYSYFIDLERNYGKNSLRKIDRVGVFITSKGDYKGSEIISKDDYNNLYSSSYENGIFDFTKLWENSSETKVEFERLICSYYKKDLIKSYRLLCDDLLIVLSHRNWEMKEKYSSKESPSNIIRDLTELYINSLLDFGLIRSIIDVKDENGDSDFWSFPNGSVLSKCTLNTDATNADAFKSLIASNFFESVYFRFSEIVFEKEKAENDEYYKRFKNDFRSTYNPIQTIANPVFNDIYSDISQKIINLSIGFNNVYVSSNRFSTKRAYSFNDHTDFTNLLKQVEYSNTDSKEVCKEFINKWIKEFDIADELILKPDIETGNFKAYLRVDDMETSLADYGLGTNQLLPIIFSLGIHTYYATQYDDELLPRTVVIEEPEANLHPAMQSKLADMFIDATKKFNVKIIAETHSEYLIRKLQYLVASNKSDAKPEDISLYYFYKPNHPDVLSGKSNQVEKIEIDKHGRLNKEFGSGFFDEADNIATELFLLSHPQSN